MNFATNFTPFTTYRRPSRLLIMRCTVSSIRCLAPSLTWFYRTYIIIIIRPCHRGHSVTHDGRIVNRHVIIWHKCKTIIITGKMVGEWTVNKGYGTKEQRRGRVASSVVLRRYNNDRRPYRWSRWTSSWMRHPRTGTGCTSCPRPSRRSATAWTAGRTSSWPSQNGCRREQYYIITQRTGPWRRRTVLLWRLRGARRRYSGVRRANTRGGCYCVNCNCLSRVSGVRGQRRLQ